MTRDTVVLPTPASCATSLRVGSEFFFIVALRDRKCSPCHESKRHRRSLQIFRQTTGIRSECLLPNCGPCYSASRVFCTQLDTDRHTDLSAVRPQNRRYLVAGQAFTDLRRSTGAGLIAAAIFPLDPLGTKLHPVLTASLAKAMQPARLPSL